MTPQRIQRKRTKGWKMPENTVSVARPGKFGNPFRVKFENNAWWVIDLDGRYWDVCENKESACNVAVRLYSHWLDGKIVTKKLDPKELRGKNLACFCKEGEPCHADVLLKLANQ